MFSIAAETSVGAAPRFVALNRFPQIELSPATPPVELMQAEIVSAIVLIAAVGTVDPLGMFVPGERPVAVFASSLANVNAAASPAAPDEPDPMAEYALI